MMLFHMTDFNVLHLHIAMLYSLTKLNKQAY